MHYHIILTQECNLRCNYCFGKSMNEFENELDKKFKFDFSEPCVSNFSIQRLESFLKRDKEAVVIFYGGEPLLQIEKIKEIMDRIKVPYRMQTNGILLDKLPSKYTNRIDKILISIDGKRETTNKNRGIGIYEKVMRNIEYIKSNGYKGEIIARMTISQENPNVYDEVLDLIKNDFKSIHWQIDAGFYKSDFEKKKIERFFREYNKSVSKLIDYWVNQIENKNFIRLYPFVAIADSFLKNENSGLRCGAGTEGYAITTSGKIVACPIMNSIEDFKAGDLESNPKSLKKFDTKEECGSCEIYNLCGGRCLYWRKSKLWPKEGDEMICDSIKHYIGKIKKEMKKINILIKNGVIKRSDFEYEKYFGPEIIP